MYKIRHFCIAIKYCFNNKIINRPIVCHANSPDLNFLFPNKFNLRHSKEINIWNVYNPWTSSFNIMNQGTWESVRQSPEYEWTWMNRHVQIEGVYRKPETLRLLYGRWGWSQKGKMNVIYGLGDGIVSERQGMFFKTRLDCHPWIHGTDGSQTTSWMDLGKLKLSRYHGRSLYKYTWAPPGLKIW